MSFQIIKRGDKSDFVGDWQTFLRGENLYIGEIDEDFGNKTHEATIKFQKKYALTQDGIVGKSTYERAIKLGFKKEDSNFPPKPNFSPITGNTTRANLFGEIQFRPNPTRANPEGIVITNNFESENIVKVSLPALSKATNGSFTSMRWNKACDYQLAKFFERLEKENLHTQILSYAGSYYPRFIRGSRTQLSNHSWGTAFDINVPQNGLGKIPALLGQKGCVRDLVPIANECGFYWGGHFTRLDGMHFEIAKIINENL